MSEFFKRVEEGMKTAGSIVGQSELAWYHNNFASYNSLLDYKMRAAQGAMDGGQAVQVYESGSVSWVNIALNRKMNDLENLDFFFVDKNGQKIPWLDVPEELRLAFDNRFAGMSIAEKIAHAGGHEDLAGNMLWVKSFGGSKNRVEQLIPITPGMFKICLNSKGTAIDYYEIKYKDGSMVNLPPEQVIHFKRNPMQNPFVGIGLVSQARATVDYLAVSADYQKTFLEKDGTPDLVYVDKNMANPQAAQAKAKQLREEYKAGKYQNSLMYAYGDVDIKSFSISSADMQFIENKQLGKNEIISMMESTPAVLGDEGSAGNKAVTSTASLNYFGVVNSRASHLVEYINSQFIWMVPGNQKKVYSLSFTPYPVGDISQIKIAVESGLLKPSHASKELGYEYSEDDPASNSLYISRALQPLETAFNPLDAGQTLNDPVGDVKKNSILEQQSETTCNHKHWYDLSFKELYTFDKKTGRNSVGAQAWQMPFLEKGKRAQDKTTKKYRPDFTKFLKAQTERILLRLDQEFNYKAPDDFIDSGEVDTLIEVIFPKQFEDMELKKTAKPLHTSGITKQIDISNELTGATVLSSISNPEVIAALMRLGEKITRVNDTTREMLRDIINTGISNGDNVLTIADNIRDAGLNEWYEGRALAIATTESRYAADAGGRMVYRELGVEKFDVLGCVGTLAAPNMLGLSSSYGDFSESNGSCGVLEVDMELWDQVSGLHHPRHQGVQAPSELPKK